MGMQNERMEGRTVNNIVGVQLMTRDNICMLLVEYKYLKDVQEEGGCRMRTVEWMALVDVHSPSNSDIQLMICLPK